MARGRLAVHGDNGDEGNDKSEAAAHGHGPWHTSGVCETRKHTKVGFILVSCFITFYRARGRHVITEENTIGRTVCPRRRSGSPAST